jgi:hypothetical protein
MLLDTDASAVNDSFYRSNFFFRNVPRILFFIGVAFA